jgi:uncharacterized protein
MYNHPMKQMRRIALWSGCVAALWLLVCALIGVAAMKRALHTPRRALVAGDESLAQEVSSRNHADLEDVQIQAEDGAILRGWSIRLPGMNRDAVILLHGQGDNRAGMLGNADLMLRHGYSVLLPDSRAHGMSGGPIVTYGIEEAGDVRRWYAWLEREQAPHCIYGVGDSMGAAILLQATAQEPGFCAIVAECTFPTLRDAGYVRLGQEMHTGPWIGETVLRPALEFGFLYGRARYGINFAQALPEKAAALTHVPILLIHGQADSNFPTRFSEEVKAENPSIALWEPAGADHCGAFAAEPAEYERRVIGWFAAHESSGGTANKE